MAKQHYWSLILALAVCFAALAVILRMEIPSVSSQEQPESPRYRIQIVLKAKANPPDFWRIVEQGILMATEEYNVDCEVTAPSSEKDVETQILLMQQAIEKRPDAIILAACDYELLAPVCEEVSRQNIPLLTIDSDVNAPNRRALIGTDNYALGKKMAALVNSLIDPEDSFGVMGHVKTVTTAVERQAGLLENVENSQGRLAALEYCDGIEALAEERTIQMLTEHPEIRCMVGLNESSALGVARALRHMGKEGTVKLVSCDSSQEQIRYMESGTIQAFVVQNPFNMGYLSVKTAVELLQGQAVPAFYDTGSLVVTKETLYKKENQKLLFPFTS